MSTTDTVTPLLSTPWFDAEGNPLSVRALPGLRPGVIQALQCSYPGIISPPLKALLETCCGLGDTALGHIDFTGCWFPPEPCTVFRPCITLAIDDAGRRWIAEIGDKDLPGPIWCMFPRPKVAVYASEDLRSFISTLRDCTCRGHTLKWLQEICAQAKTVWTWRHTLARRPYELHESDEEISGWLAGLPSNAYVYDLRKPMITQGWPYGLAGPSGRLYRCGRLPVFAVAGSPSEGWYQKTSATIPPITPGSEALAEVNYVVATLRNPRRSRALPCHAIPWPAIGRASGFNSTTRSQCTPGRSLELRRCA